METWLPVRLPNVCCLSLVWSMGDLLIGISRCTGSLIPNNDIMAVFSVPSEDGLAIDGGFEH